MIAEMLGVEGTAVASLADTISFMSVGVGVKHAFIGSRISATDIRNLGRFD